MLTSVRYLADVPLTDINDRSDRKVIEEGTKISNNESENIENVVRPYFFH